MRHTSKKHVRSLVIDDEIHTSNNFKTSFMFFKFRTTFSIRKSMKQGLTFLSKGNCLCRHRDCWNRSHWSVHRLVKRLPGQALLLRMVFCQRICN